MGNIQSQSEDQQKLLLIQTVNELENIANEVDWLSTTRRHSLEKPDGLPSNYRTMLQSKKNEIIVNIYIPKLLKKLEFITSLLDITLRQKIITIEHEVNDVKTTRDFEHLFEKIEDILKEIRSSYQFSFGKHKRYRHRKHRKSTKHRKNK